MSKNFEGGLSWWEVLKMKVYKHKSYEEYKKAQISKNVKKLETVWIKEGELKKIVEHINRNLFNVRHGICHGVRNAWEVKKFREFLKADIIGTEISYTATKFNYTIQWDFHDIKDDWIGKFDFIYSNSFDHSNKPKYCLDQWMKCLKPDGICYIHWNYENSKLEALDAADCFTASQEEYRKLFNEKYKVIDEFATIANTRIVFAIKHV